jgi:DNA-binding transcriptional MerR regulator
MNKVVVSREELLRSTGLSKETLADWIKWKLVRPVGFTEDQAPLFSEETLDRAADIQKLTDLGYKLEDIQKILKKVGFPGK